MRWTERRWRFRRAPEIIPKSHPYLRVRELEEETGYRSDNLELLITLRTAIAYCNELIDVYVARDLIPSKQHLDEDEFLDVEEYTLDELCQMIYQGTIQDAKTVAAIMAYKAKYQK